MVLLTAVVIALLTQVVMHRCAASWLQGSERAVPPTGVRAFAPVPAGQKVLASSVACERRVFSLFPAAPTHL